MKLRTLAGAALVLALCSCATSTTKNLQPSTVYTLRNGYDAAFLVPAANYSSLKRCAAGVSFTVAAPCSEVAVIKKLQQVDKVAEKALNDLQSFTISNPTLDASAYLSAARIAISNAENVISVYK